MKMLEELGISPTPWHNYGPDCEVFDAKQVPLTDEFGLHGNHNDRWFIAAAPEMYECLRWAVLLKCSGCASDAGDKCLWQGECFAKRWRAALERAGGAE